MRSILTALAIAGAAVAPCHAQLLPCPGMTVAAPPSVPDGGSLPLAPPPENPASCVAGLKFVPGPGVTLWRCVVDHEPEKEPADPWLNALLVMPDGQPTQALRDNVMAGQLQLMRAVKADLDGDGTAENILALWNAAGNGMGVSHWTLHVFTSGWRLLHTFTDVEDWGRTAVVAAPAGRKGCDLAVTGWSEGKNASGKAGLYLEARFQQLVGGAFQPAADRPALRRRYTYAFQDQRNSASQASADDEADVAAWLSHRSVEKLP